MQDRIVGEGITFDDVLLLPGYSDVLGSDVDVTTRLSRRVDLKVPIVSSAMDTVTESALAISLAQQGGIGIIHKNLSIERQVKEVYLVKRSVNGIIYDPITLPPTETIGTAKKTMEENKISGIPIVEGAKKVVGILTSRDLRFRTDDDASISDVMTKDHLVTGPIDTTLEVAQESLHRHKVEKLLLVDDKMNLQGLITIKDIDKLLQFPQANLDRQGRLRAGAAVGAVGDARERAAALVEQGVDVLVIDTAHGHSKNVGLTIEQLKGDHDVDVIAGNVATGEGAKFLADRGADAVKVGIGPGSICTTRVIAGIGVPQLTAVASAVHALESTDVPVISDGGVRFSGDIVKALAAGAHCAMVGSLFAGTEESPGEMVLYHGRTFKSYRGMGSLGAMARGSKDRYGQHEIRATEKFVPEGVEGRVPYKGRLADLVHQLVGGLRQGMGYCGTVNIEELRTKARFLRASSAGVAESHPHDIEITKEAPNYRVDR
ncbi:MAG: IMP dehydrogenase [Planctomycetota bacterium]|jgi:IMP dehydrogenase